MTPCMRFFTAALALLGGLAPCLADETSSNVLITSAERLAIKILGYPDLSGEYRVNPDQTVSIPGLGRIPIADTTPASLEGLISKKVSEVTNRQASVSVEIAQYRPIFVTGSVRNPGVVPWQPGMTVLTAVAVAGGVQRGTGTSGDVSGAADSGKIRLGVDELKRQIATLARLQAEQSGASTVQVPDQLVRLVGRTEAQALIDSQKALFESHRASLQGQLSALQRNETLAQNELSALDSQQQLITEQLGLRRESQKRMADLQKRGIIRADRVDEEDLKVSGLEEKRINVLVGMAQVRSTLAGMDRDKIVLQEEYKSRLESEIASVEQKIAQRQIELDSMGGPELVASNSAEVPSSDTNDVNMVSFSIVRAGSGTAQAATSETAVSPGDVIVTQLSFKP